MSTPISLQQHLAEQRNADSDLTTLLLEISTICNRIASDVAKGVLLSKPANLITDINVQGEEQKPLDVLSNQYFVDRLKHAPQVAGLASEEMDKPIYCQKDAPYLVIFDPLDGSSNIDVNVSVGSIFSILKKPEACQNRTLQESDFLQSGSRQVAAGYAIYGPVTMLVLAYGDGTHGFTLDQSTHQFVLTHLHLKIKAQTAEFAINMSNHRFWYPFISRYVSECLEGTTGTRNKDFNMRWIASLVAETHRILMRGGVFMYPRDQKDPKKEGRLRLMYEANPIGKIIESAGGLASTGFTNVLNITPTNLHQRIGFVFGSSQEVTRIEAYAEQEK